MECPGLRSEIATFDLCDKAACLGSTIEKRRDGLPSQWHLPTHNIVKIRTPIIHVREIGKLLENAETGLRRAESLLQEAKEKTDGGTLFESPIVQR